MAKSLRLIAETYGDAFYKGELADKIDAFMQEHNGFLRKSDLEGLKAKYPEKFQMKHYTPETGLCWMDYVVEEA